MKIQSGDSFPRVGVTGVDGNSIISDTGKLSSKRAPDKSRRIMYRYHGVTAMPRVDRERKREKERERERGKRGGRMHRMDRWAERERARRFRYYAREAYCK